MRMLVLFLQYENAAKVENSHKHSIRHREFISLGPYWVVFQMKKALQVRVGGMGKDLAFLF